MPKRIRRTRSRKKLSWKRLRNLSKLRRRLRTVVWALAAIILTAAVLTAISLYQFFKAPFAQAQGALPREISWSGKNHLNLALIEISDLSDSQAQITRLAVLGIEPVDGSLSLLTVPTSATPKADVALVTRTLVSLLAIPVDGYLLMDETGMSNAKCQMSNIRWKTVWCILQSLPTLRQYLRTDLSLVELLRVGRFALTVRSDRIKMVNLESSDFENQTHLDGIIKRLFSDEKVKDERLKIMVLNGTTEPGLASKAARVVGNLGGDVIEVGNDENQYQKESVIVTDKKDSYTVRRLSRVFDISILHPPSSILHRRADCTLILGLDKVTNLWYK